MGAAKNRKFNVLLEPNCRDNSGKIYYDGRIIGGIWTWPEGWSEQGKWHFNREKLAFEYKMPEPPHSFESQELLLQFLIDWNNNRLNKIPLAI